MKLAKTIVSLSELQYTGAKVFMDYSLITSDFFMREFVPAVVANNKRAEAGLPGFKPINIFYTKSDYYKLFIGQNEIKERKISSDFSKSVYNRIAARNTLQYFLVSNDFNMYSKTYENGKMPELQDILKEELTSNDIVLISGKPSKADKLFRQISDNIGCRNFKAFALTGLKHNQNPSLQLHLSTWKAPILPEPSIYLSL